MKAREWVLDRIMGTWHVTRQTQHEYYETSPTAIVREVLPDTVTISKAELFASYTLASRRHFYPESKEDHGTLPCLIWQELMQMIAFDGERSR